MLIRQLTEADVVIFRVVRLRSLRDDPNAFTNSYEEFSQRSLEDIAERFRRHSPENFLLGAFNDEQLVGMVGFFREEALKIRHRGNIVSLYVVPEARGQGIGRALLTEAIQRAAQLSGLEQLLLGVVVTQTAAKRLYELLGFVVYGREPRAVKIGDRYYAEEFMILDLEKQGAT